MLGRFAQTEDSSAAANECDDLDRVAADEGVVFVRGFGRELAVDLDGAGGAAEFEVLDQPGDGGAHGDLAGLAVDFQPHDLSGRHHGR